MAFSLGPFKINNEDKLRTGFRAKYNLLLNKVIKDGAAIENGFKLITHDGSELEVDLLDYFYNKEQIDELFFIEYATEEEAGKIRIATMEEVLDGVDDVTVVTPYKLAQLLLTFNGRAVIAGEDLVPGDYVYLELGEEEVIDPEDPESEPEFFPILLAKKSIATSVKTMVMGWIEYDALEGEETFIRFSGSINTFHLDLIPGQYYFLSDEDPSVLLPEPPQASGSVQQIVGYAISELEMRVEIHKPYLNWANVFLPEFPDLYFEIGKESADSVLLTDYLSEYNIVEEETNEEDPGEEPRIITGYSYRFLILPEWVTTHVVVFENLTIGGTPTKVGRESAFLEVTDRDKRVFLHEIYLYTNPPTKVGASLYDLSDGLLDQIGPIPGVYEVVDKIDVDYTINGVHDEYEAVLRGGGDTGSFMDKVIRQKVNRSSLATYRMFETENGALAEPGQYTLTITTFRNENQVSVTTLMFILYDEEFLDKLKFYLVSADVEIGEIAPDGTSNFSNPGVADVKSVVTAVSHDKAVVELSLNGAVIQDEEYPHSGVITDAEYLAYGEDTALAAGEYTIKISLYVGPNLVLVRYTVFTIAEASKPVTGGLKFVTMLPGKQDYNVITTLAPSGNLLSWPANWNILSDAESEPYDYESFWLKQLKGGGLPEIDIEKYTGQPQYNDYAYPITSNEELLFGFKNSKNIGNIHPDDPEAATFRVNFTRRLGGANGKIVAIFQADFSFDELEDIEETPEDPPGSDYVAYYPGRGLSLIPTKGAATFNVNTDEVTIEIYNQTNILQNWLRVKDKAITYVKFQDMPQNTVLGKLTTGTGTPYAVPVLTSTSVATPDDSNLVTSGWVKAFANSAYTGVVNRFAIFNTTTSLTSSILELAGINVTAREGQFVSDHAFNTNVRGFVVQEGGQSRFSFGKLGSSADFAFWRFNDLGNAVLGTPIAIERATGKVTLETQLTILGSILPPLIVSSAAWVQNLNVDYLDDHHGPYYLDRANHTGTQLANTISNFSPAVLATTLLGLATTNSSITSSDTILQAFGKIQGQITGKISGTIGRLPYFNTTGSIADSIASQSGINLTVDGQFISNVADNVNIRGLGFWRGGANRWLAGKIDLEGGSNSGSNFALQAFDDAGSTLLSTPIKIMRATGAMTLSTQLTIQGSVLPPLVVDSSAWIENANVDYLDDHHGDYYLDWNNLTNKKSIIAGAGLTGGGILDTDRGINMGTPSTLSNTTINTASGSTHTHAIQVSNLVAGTNVSLSASGTGVILGPNHITINVTSVPWSTGVSGKPTTIAGFGIVDAPTIDYVDIQLSGKENTFSKADLIQGSGISLSGPLSDRLVSTGDVTISLAASGVTAGTYRSVTVDVYGRVTAGTNPSTGISGTAGYISQFGAGGTTVVDSVIRDTGTEINIAGSRDFGVEGPAAMRDYLHVHGYQSNGTASNHGQIVVHNESSATPHASAAIEIRSTTKGLLLPRMTTTQRQAISSPAAGLVVFQTDGGAGGLGGYLHIGSNVWIRLLWDYIGA